MPAEIENCQDYLFRQIELIEPRVVCTLGNFATKLLRGEPTGITRLHGQPEIRVIGGRAGAPLPAVPSRPQRSTRRRTSRSCATISAGFPELLAMPLPEQPGAPEPELEPEPAPVGAPQLGLF